MGMYTEMNISVWLRGDTPDDVISTLQVMVNPNGLISYRERPNHPLFLTERWQYMLVADSAYFPGDPHAELIYDNYTNVWELAVRSSLKNYNSEIELFLNFIHPYLTDDGFVGYMRCEEMYDPELIYSEHDAIKVMNVSAKSYYKLDDEWSERKHKCLLKKKDVRELSRRDPWKNN